MSISRAHFNNTIPIARRCLSNRVPPEMPADGEDELPDLAVLLFGRR